MIRSQRSRLLLTAFLIAVAGFSYSRPGTISGSTVERHIHSYTDDTERDKRVKEAVDENIRRFPLACQGKESILEILHSGISTVSVTEEVCLRLPFPGQVEELYGKKPVVYGMETCQAYRDMLTSAGNKPALVRVAGLFKTGTNAFAKSLERNLQQDDEVWDEQIRQRAKSEGGFAESGLYDVPWEKHIHVKYRWESTAWFGKGVDKKLVLPVVLVRDPYWWMRSMVRFLVFCKYVSTY